MWKALRPTAVWKTNLSLRNGECFQIDLSQVFPCGLHWPISPSLHWIMPWFGGTVRFVTNGCHTHRKESYSPPTVHAHIKYLLPATNPYFLYILINTPCGNPLLHHYSSNSSENTLCTSNVVATVWGVPVYEAMSKNTWFTESGVKELNRPSKSRLE